MIGNNLSFKRKVLTEIMRISHLYLHRRRQLPVVGTTPKHALLLMLRT
jgi:hypothetical protein